MVYNNIKNRLKIDHIIIRSHIYSVVVHWTLMMSSFFRPKYSLMWNMKFSGVIKFPTKLAISLCPIVANMTGLIGKIAPRAHQSNCAQGSSADLRPGLIGRSAPGLIRRTAPGRKWAHPASKYTWLMTYTYICIDRQGVNMSNILIYYEHFICI